MLKTLKEKNNPMPKIEQFYWHINLILTGTTSSGHSGSLSNGNEGVLLIPQNSKSEASSLGQV